jgi:putative membrane protein
MGASYPAAGLPGGNQLRTLLIRWAVIVIAVFLVAWGLPQTGLVKEPLIRYDDWVTLAIFAAVLALLNTFVRPILLFLSIPFTCLTLGLFVLVINTAMFALAAALVPGFSVSGFWGAFIGALAVSVVGIAINMLTSETQRYSR